MKSPLILISILALVFSTPVEETNDIKDYIEIVKCFLEQQPLIDDVNSIVEMIKTQDFSQAITLLFKAYGDVQAAISKCMPHELKSPICCMTCRGDYLGRILEHENQKEKEFTLEEIEEMYRKCKLTCPPYYCGEKKSFL